MARQVGLRHQAWQPQCASIGYKVLGPIGYGLRALTASIFGTPPLARARANCAYVYTWSPVGLAWVPASARRSRMWRRCHLGRRDPGCNRVELTTQPAVAGDAPTLGSPASDPQSRPCSPACHPYGARAPVTLGIGSGGVSPAIPV